jgi:CBS domain-containing membrane protein
VQLLYASFGSSAVLLFSAYQTPFAQPWNVFMGQTVSAFCGVCVRLFFTHAVPPYGDWIKYPCAVAVAIAAMDIFDCVHPSGKTPWMCTVIV